MSHCHSIRQPVWAVKSEPLRLVPAATQNGSQPSVGLLPPPAAWPEPVSCMEPVQSSCILPLEGFGKLENQMFHVNLHVNTCPHIRVLEMEQMPPGLLSCLLPPGRVLQVLRVHVQSEMPPTRHKSESLFRIPCYLISPDAAEITTFFAGLLSNEKIFGSS